MLIFANLSPERWIYQSDIEMGQILFLLLSRIMRYCVLEVIFWSLLNYFKKTSYKNPLNFSIFTAFVIEAYLLEYESSEKSQFELKVEAKITELGLNLNVEKSNE